MIQRVDSPLHTAAKQRNYPACYAILTASLRAMPAYMPPKEVQETARNSYNKDLRYVEQSEEFQAALRMAAALAKQMEEESIKQRAIIKELRTAENAEGLIARECCEYDTPEPLRQLLDPSYDVVSAFINGRAPRVTMPESRTLNIGDTVTVNGKVYGCTERFRISRDDE